MTSYSSRFVPLKDVLADVERVSDKEDYVSTEGVIPAAKVAEAKNHVLNMYRGVQEAGSFHNERLDVFDNIPFEMQLGVRDLQDKTIPVAPDLRPSDEKADVEQSGQRVGPSIRDELGNQVLPPLGTVAVKRITLNDIARYGSIESFFSKGGNILASSDTVGGDGLYHRYAVASQNVDLYGASAKMSVHKLSVSAAARQGFSVSQMWLQSGSYQTNLQSIEPAIITQPLQYGNDPVFVIFYTNDGYKPGSTSFNHDNGDFVQTDNKWLLGSPIKPVSTVDGNQYYLHITVKFDSGKWWIYLGGDASTNAIGYYPTSLFSKVTANGLAVKASVFQVGGETSVQAIEPAVFAPMGSGQLASTGWKKSAYARDLKYYNAAGTAVTATVQSISTSPRYGGQRNRYAAPWNETWWYGGPGGT